MFSDSDNPYRPPCGQSVSVADWTLFKRVFYTLAVWAIVYLAVAAYGTWASMQSSRRYSGITAWELITEYNMPKQIH